MINEEMMKNEAVVELRNLTTGYTNKHKVRVVAENLNAEILSGELTCLLGANGSGKSTLLKTLSAFLPAISGDVMIKGRKLEDYSSKRLARQIGVVLTERCSIRNISVGELVGMGRSPYTGFWGRLSKKDMEIVDEALDFVKITALKNRMVHTLSDGERQKVMIAKALAQQTPIIFLDEPTAFLDYPSKVEIMQLLYNLSKETNRTVFLSTHDLELALQIADKVWLMKKNEGVSIGTPEDLSMNGSLKNFFPDTGIVFDTRSGLYQIKHNFKSYITLEGDHHSNVYMMVRKALNRVGFAVVKSGTLNNTGLPDSGIIVECTSEGLYILKFKSGEKENFRTIGALLERIR